MTRSAARVAVHGTIGRGDFSTVVDIAIEPGHTVIVRGPNGAGKTTLLRTIAGLDAVVDGEVHIDGIAADAPAARVFVPAHRRHVAMAFQEARLFPHLRVAPNVAFGLKASGVSRAEAERRALRALASTGAEHLADARPSELSGGQAQRVGLARALALEAPVLLVDEPLSAVDADIRNELRDLIAAHPATTLWVTHADPSSLPSDATVIEL